MNDGALPISVTVSVSVSEAFLSNALAGVIMAIAAVLCVLPLGEDLRFSRKTTCIAVAAFCVATPLALPVLCSVTGMSNNAVLLVLLPVLFLLLQSMTTIRPAHTLLVLASVMCLLALTNNFGFVTEFLLYRSELEGGGAVWHVESMAVQCGVAFALMLGLLRPVSRQLRWLVHNLDRMPLSSIVWLFPALLLTFSVCLQPLNPATFDNSRVLVMSLVLAVMLMGILSLFFVLLYTTMRQWIANEKLQQEAHVAQMQKRRYETLRESIDHARQAHHDFRHEVLLLRSLLEEGKTDEVLARFDHQLASTRPSIGTLCRNHAVDSVASHFAEQAVGLGVRVDVELGLPERLPVDESKLCILLANLLENAVEALRPQMARRASGSLGGDADADARRGDGGDSIAGAGAGLGLGENGIMGASTGLGLGEGRDGDADADLCGANAGDDAGADDAPFLRVRACVVDESNVLLVVENTFDGSVTLVDGLPASTKGDDQPKAHDERGRGYGLQSVRQIVERHGGILRISTDDGVFRVNALLHGEAPDANVGADQDASRGRRGASRVLRPDSDAGADQNASAGANADMAANQDAGAGANAGS